MKKVIIALLVLASLFAFVSCGALEDKIDALDAKIDAKDTKPATITVQKGLLTAEFDTPVKPEDVFVFKGDAAFTEWSFFEGSETKIKFNDSVEAGVYTIYDGKNFAFVNVEAAKDEEAASDFFASVESGTGNLEFVVYAKEGKDLTKDLPVKYYAFIGEEDDGFSYENLESAVELTVVNKEKAKFTIAAPLEKTVGNYVFICGIKGNGVERTAKFKYALQ